jgi:DNA-binding transcriptional MerR regulator/effector-binding domain-containing protein
MEENYLRKNLSIGELSKLQNISIQALRHYDKVGLLKPAYIDKGSNYRYYTIDQIPNVDIIKNLKYLGFSLESIKSIIVKNESLEELLEKLETQERLIDERLQELTKVKRALSHKIHNIRESMERKNFGEVYLSEIAERKCIHVPLKNNYEEINADDLIVLALRNLGMIIEKENLTEGQLGVTSKILGDKVNYEDIFMLVEENSSLANYKDIKVIPAGTYLCILYRGIDDSSEIYYRKLLEYIKEKNYVTNSEFYEISLLNGITIPNPADYIVEIQILIK